MFKSVLTGALVLEKEGVYTIIYRGYSILQTDNIATAKMTAISRVDCDKLFEEKTHTYLKQA